MAARFGAKIIPFGAVGEDDISENDTGLKQELKDRDKAHELYLRVKSEVGRWLAYLKEKRESDPYRNLLSRLIYLATHGFTSEIPTFKL
ncbi:acyltransferase-like protein [Quercus suber]|uniref:Acyltransferase-like protein n=1 Tax=Quercus suber TaxID=58331 RepID=A0AAW0JKC2_QUESU